MSSKIIFSKSFFINLIILLIPINFILGNLLLNLNVIILITLALFFYGLDIFKIKFDNIDRLILIFFLYLFINGIVNNYLVREDDFIQVALAQGYGPMRIMFKHILPNVTSPIIVATTLNIGNIILFESVLSFLGLGIQPPVASWGNMLTGAQELIYEDPKLAIWSCTLIFLTVIAFNFLGDSLQRAFRTRSIQIIG